MKAHLVGLIGLVGLGNCAIPERHHEKEIFDPTDVVMSKQMAYTMLHGKKIDGAVAEEGPEIPEELPTPSCAPSKSLLAAFDWMYVPNSSKKDVWFAVVRKPARNWDASKAACEALGSGIHLASIVNAAEDQVLAKWRPNGDSKEKPWTGGYTNDGNTFYWLYGASSQNEKFSYTNWYEGFPKHVPGYAVKITIGGTKDSGGFFKDEPASDERIQLCMMRCNNL